MDKKEKLELENEKLMALLEFTEAKLLKLQTEIKALKDTIHGVKNNNIDSIISELIDLFGDEDDK